MDELLPPHVNYWLNSSKCDCLFKVGDPNGQTERIGAIKIFLMGHSEPMRKMLEESDIAEKEDIALPDIDPKSFRHFLVCIYGGGSVITTNLSYDECFKVLYIAEKYLVAQVKQDVLLQMRKLLPLSLDNWFTAVSPSNFTLFQDNFCIDEIKIRIEKDAYNLFADSRFLNISTEVLFVIVKEDKLNASEIDVFNALVNWAQHQLQTTVGETLRPFISHHLQYIRFRIMSLREFSIHVIPTRVLTAYESSEMCTSIALNKPHGLNLLSESCHKRVRNTFTKPERLACSYVLQNVSSLNVMEYVYSSFIQLNDYYWRFFIDKQEVSFGLYIECKPVNVSSSWSCNAQIELIVVNRRGNEDFKRSFSHVFHPDAKGSGFARFMNWNDLINPLKGYLHMDDILLLAYITYI